MLVMAGTVFKLSLCGFERSPFSQQRAKPECASNFTIFAHFTVGYSRTNIEAISKSNFSLPAAA